MGTAEVKGEDNEAKGAVYLFEVAHLEVSSCLMRGFNFYFHTLCSWKAPKVVCFSA
jgi:hypothetical protein